MICSKQPVKRSMPFVEHRSWSRAPYGNQNLFLPPLAICYEGILTMGVSAEYGHLREFFWIRVFFRNHVANRAKFILLPLALSIVYKYKAKGRK